MDSINIVTQGSAPSQRRFMDLSSVGDRAEDLIRHPEFLPGLRPRLVAALSGDGGVGKSRAALQMCVAACSIKHDLSPIGNLAPSAPTLRGPVLFLTTEDEEEELHNMLTRVRIHLRETMTKRVADQVWSDVRPNLHIKSEVAADLELYDEQRRLRPDVLASLADNVRGHRLAVIDKLPDLAGVHEENNGMLVRIMRDLRRLAVQQNTAILALHDHTKNATVENEMAAARGASSIRNKVRAMFAMWPLPLAEAPKLGITAEEAWRFALFRANKQNHGALSAQCWLERRTGDAGGVLVETDRIPQSYVPGAPIQRGAASRKEPSRATQGVREYALAD